MFISKLVDIWKYGWCMKVWLIHENLVNLWKSGWYMKIWLIYAPVSDLESDRFWGAEVFAGDGTRFLTFRVSFRVRRMFKWCEPPTCLLTFELTFRVGEVNNSTNLRHPPTSLLGRLQMLKLKSEAIKTWNKEIFSGRNICWERLASFSN